MTALTPSFHLKFGHAILPGKVAVGRLDGKHPSLAAATTGGRILLHTPHELGGAGAEEAGAGASTKQPLRFLNINREVTALATGRLLAGGGGREALLVGTASSFQAYDVGENRDLFFREVPDAVTAAVVGTWGGGGGAPLAFAGGNCSIQGYDAEGADAYWTVAGDVVAAAAFGDVDGDGRPELLVGGDDFDIRLYRGEEAAREATETDKVACLLVCPGARFAYALCNGTVGVYAGSTFTRAWRVKGRSRPTCLALFDIDGDGTPELLAGYADGRFEARRVGSGEVVYRDGIGAAVAGLAVADYRGDGREVLLVVGADGEVRGYGQSDADTLAAIRTAAAGAAAASSATAAAAAAASAGAAEGPAAAAAAAAAKKAAAAPGAAPAGADIAALLGERAQLEAELRALEVLQAAGGGGASGGAAGSRRGSSLLSAGSAPPASAGALPASTDISLALTHNVAARRLELVATCTGGGGGGAEGTAGGGGSAASAASPLLLRSLVVYALDAGVLGSERESVVAVSPLTLAGSVSALGGSQLVSPPADAASASSAGGSSSLSVPLAPAANVATELRVQAVVGAHHSSAHYAVICRPFALPKFAMFALLSGAPALAAAAPAPRGVVSFELPERAQRVSMWLQAAFGLRPEQAPVGMSSPALQVRLLHLRSGRPLSISVAAEHGGAVFLACDEMGLAGELVQDMAAYLALAELPSSADFPEELAAFTRTLAAMGELTAIRARMTGDSAAASGEVKALVIGAEDARLLGDMGGLRRCYGQLRALHGELVGEYAKRANNHAALVGVLKEVNQMIQKAANLRVGEARSRVIAACRAAIKSGTPTGMITVIQQGRA